MNEDVIQDLKQFISTTVSQQTSGLATKEDISDLDNKLSRKIDDLSDSVADALESGNEATEVHISNHEKRITKLEQKLA